MLMSRFKNDVAPESSASASPRPWYREMYVWLLILIPAAAFIAGLITLILAFHGADVELAHP